MAFDNPPFVMDATTIDGEVIRRALGTLLGSAGGIVSTGDLQVTQQASPNMSVLVGTGQIWVPGTSTATQGPYYSRNGAAVTLAISASNPSNPRIDTIVVQVQDAVYAGVVTSIAPAVITGTPTAGATLANLNGKGAVPASSLVLAYVLVPAAATTIVTADIANVASIASRASGPWVTIPAGDYQAGVSQEAAPYGAQYRISGDSVSLRGQVSGTFAPGPTQVFKTGSLPAPPATRAVMGIGASGVPFLVLIGANGAVSATSAALTNQLTDTALWFAEGASYSLGS